MNIKNTAITILLGISLFTNAQTGKYKAEKEKINDLVHTKLNVSFDIPKSLLYGEAWITLTPHFYETSKVQFDAKGMIIHSVTMNGLKRPYNYFENQELIVDLDRMYKKGEEFTIYIKYTAQPKIYGKKNGGQKGLYFINPRGEDLEKPAQIWTEGETENNSIWFPTIDSPNQKTTQELSMTVPQNFVTLSNGILISQKYNFDGTRTDYWKQDLKHAPYLFFMSAGEFSIVKDTWKGKEISYYVEKEYESVARLIFGKTSKMLQFYEDLLGVEYPWDKYSQIVVRDYVSGAMENTTAVVHAEGAYQKEGELIDGNKWEATIAHEVFHHWFGNLVTAESWSNLSMNESFANYAEYLWIEYEYGKDAANYHLLQGKNAYIKGNNSDTKDLIRFKYESRKDMFDLVSYQKGGLILHMLRNYLGDKAFFEGLKKYLTDNQFGTGEAHQLRLALEAVSGKDLNWFFNQWFFNNSHPKLVVKHTVGEFEDVVMVHISQTENVFEFPLTIDIYEKDGQKSTHNVWIDERERIFTFPVSSKPKLVHLNPQYTLLAEIIHSKTTEEYIYQYSHVENYIARKEALDKITLYQDDKTAFRAVVKALNDTSFRLRIVALKALDLKNKHNKTDVIKVVERLAKNDSHTLVQAAANITLAKLVDPKYIGHFVNALSSKSYKVIESAVVALYQLDKKNALKKVETLSDDVKEHLVAVLTGYYLENRSEEYMPYISKNLAQGLFFIKDKKVANFYRSAFEWISKSDNKTAIQNLVGNLVKTGEKHKKYSGDFVAINFLKEMVVMQKKSKHSNKRELELIIRTGIAKLVE